jgi:FkbM family methyltransferase
MRTRLFLLKAWAEMARWYGRNVHYLGDAIISFRTIFGFTIYLDGRDDSLTPVILRKGMWESHICGYILASLKNGGVFLDIGANNGFHSLLAAKITGKHGIVVAFEPQSRLCKILARTVAANRYHDRLKIVNCAIGAEDGHGSLGLIDNLSGSATLTVNERISEREDTAIRTMASALEIANIHQPIISPLIKIDTEGYEYNVWLSLRDWLKDIESATILMEFTPISYIAQNIDPGFFISDFENCGFSVKNLERSGKISDFDEREFKSFASQNRYYDLILEKCVR